MEGIGKIVREQRRRREFTRWDRNVGFYTTKSSNVSNTDVFGVCEAELDLKSKSLLSVFWKRGFPA